jgi:NAD(P)-dependent dehydrogenase (short-subunit alcohol dehydrogenase family)
MVSLSSVQASNSLIATTLLPNLVAVFVGATSGIGEISLKKFAKYTVKPKAYFVGRSQEAGDRITAECKKLNPDGEYNFIKVDVSLIKNVDEVCDDIKKKEKTINILFLSAGAVHLDRSGMFIQSRGKKLRASELIMRTVTSENLHLLLALTFYSRVRFINNLTPLLQKATSLRRVVYVAGGGKEGVLDSSDFQALHVPFIGLRAHLTTMISLALEAVAKR